MVLVRAGTHVGACRHIDPDGPARLGKSPEGSAGRDVMREEVVVQIECMLLCDDCVGWSETRHHEAGELAPIAQDFVLETDIVDEMGVLNGS